jgi:hypothetical protein
LVGLGACAAEKNAEQPNPIGAGEGGGGVGMPTAGTAAGVGVAGMGTMAGTGAGAGATETGGTGGMAGVPGTGGSAGTVAPVTDAGTDAMAGSDAQAPVEPTTGPFPPVSDFTVAGPYTSKTLVNVGPNNAYTVYLPTELAPGGAKNPIVGWMSGGGTSHTGYVLLPHLATHGFVVVASNSIPGIGAEVTLGQEIIAGIDWAIAENSRAGSEMEGKLDTTMLASMGYSMGSLATFTIADDPRLITTVHISGGNMAPERVQNLHAPAAFICGVAGDASCNILSTTCDIAGGNCAMDFANATTPVFYAVFESGHLGILSQPFATRINAMTTAWLRFRLMGDTTLRDDFVGADCTYCADANWDVQQKNLVQ